MFNTNGLNIEMFEGDYGERLPINVEKGEILEGDILKMIIKTPRHEEIVNKQIELSEDDSFIFFLTKEESESLTKGTYLWSLKQFREGYLIDTLTANNLFKVKRG